MYFLHFHFPSLQYFLNKKLTNFFLSIAIRYFAIGMVAVFEPIFIYLFFQKSIFLTLLFFGAIHGLYGLLVVYGGKASARFGLRLSILFGNLLMFLYFLFLFLLPDYSWLISLSIIVKSLAMMFFWPAFNTDFVRFSKKRQRGLAVGKLNLVRIIPVIAAPLIGGWIVANFGYSALFAIVLITLLVSFFPLYFAKEGGEVYTDSYWGAWQRIFKKENIGRTIALVAMGVEVGINRYIWPIFLSVLAISSLSIGWIFSIAFAVSALFSIYIGKATDTVRRSALLKIGSLLTAVSWIFKYFVTTPFSALLAHLLYRFSHSAAGIPFVTILYERAEELGDEADEFIVYREIVSNLSRSFFLFALAVLFFFIPQINIAFIFAAVLSLLFMFLCKPFSKKIKPSKT